MAQQIKMPNLGSDMTEGVLLNWTKKVGDQINAGDVIAEIETDKATVEVPAEAGGTLLALIGEPGSSLKVGSVIGWVGAAGEDVPAANGGAPAQRPASTSAPTAISASVTPTAISPSVTPTRPGGGSPPPPRPTQKPAEDDVDENLPDGIKASPVARAIARERNIDLRQVNGTGPGGRIIKADVEAWQPPAAPAPAQAPAAAPIAAQTFGELPSGPDVEIIDTSKIRSRIARRMIDAKQQTPHFYVTNELDVEALLDFRKQINAGLDDAHKISVNDLIVKATALSLREFPNLNTHYYGDKLVRHKRINIGIAVAIPGGGLVNVVAKDADRVSLSALAQINKEMIGRAREGKVKPDDIQGSTFTVSNLGAYDVEHFLAIINPPEAGILAIGSAMKIPVVKADGTLGIGNRMRVTVSVDHRVSDGAEGAQFLQAFKKYIEAPMRLI
ncbi:MAG: 2-oxo acid dehydrogenase subunit E2 [Anaerolineae bacterium]|uniref:dihydrolipoamide acetyltransferase family protein n=1 Tax=Candidatus Flexifilum breve TaxID=3140694 RepID=UPI001AC5D102|nr:2-oxo acid dehydrogenase subunit E2 [Chloroflexota bacterium]MBK9750937.1 2-oxo acid dehydrogenase subunit E2 [Chloroflexota bacterium]MBN8633846.1 2-oxo acid dehydrogenase subunit E2 [Anaerolineae bacterium]